MRFVYRIEIIDALTRSEACAKQIVHLFESRLAGLTADWLRPGLFPTLAPEIHNSLTAQ